MTYIGPWKCTHIIYLTFFNNRDYDFSEQLIIQALKNIVLKFMQCIGLFPIKKKVRRVKTIKR